MSLWIAFCDECSDEHIEQACAVAQASLDAAGTTAPAAQDAALAAADLSQDHDGATPDADLIIAWYQAEAAAFEKLAELSGTWPTSAHTAALLYVQQGE